jgi:uncharacterized protein (DUF488 family)
MILTIGHSNHRIERFLELLKGAGVTALADVRSQPHSRWASQFNKEALAGTLAEKGIAYVFLGKELGGRPKDKALLKDGKPDYEAMAGSENFRAGIVRVLEGAKTHRIALMCAERDPIDCHRFVLIGRHLAAHGVPIAHILATGEVETHADTERRFAARKGGADLFG